MALGSTNGYQGNNQNQQQMYNPNYYSRLRFKNFNDGLSLTFTFWNGVLKISITSQGQDGKANDLATIYMSPTKAKIFATGIQKVIDNPESFDAFGVDTGGGETRGLILISREMGKPYLLIGKVNNQGGYDSRQKYYFDGSNSYILNITDVDKVTFKKEFDENLELVQFKELLEDFARYASGAAGAAFYDIGRYEAAKSSNLIKKIAEKVGVQGFNGGNYQRSNNSFFSGADQEYSTPNPTKNSTQKKSTYQSIDDMVGELG